MSLIAVSTVHALAAGEPLEGISPFVVGGVVLGGLLALLLALLAFGAGREHS